jgi:protein-S-isoprenylcysteine O-methyltransferase Ste14
MSAMNDAVQTPIVRGVPGPAVRKAILLVSIAAAIAYLVLGGSRWPSDAALHGSIAWSGITMILICIAGRTWCALYIGGIKNQTLVTQGPYSICRNPLYLFSVIGTVGVAAQAGSFAITLTVGVLAWVTFYWWATSEEGKLFELFGGEYRRYHDLVPRFVPNVRLWRDIAIVPMRPRAVIKTFADSLFLLIAIPACAGFEYLHKIGVLTTYLNLP